MDAVKYEETEKKFAQVIVKILRRMIQIENELAHACGSVER